MRDRQPVERSAADDEVDSAREERVCGSIGFEGGAPRKPMESGYPCLCATDARRSPYTAANLPTLATPAHYGFPDNNLACRAARSLSLNPSSSRR